MVFGVKKGLLNGLPPCSCAFFRGSWVAKLCGRHVKIWFIASLKCISFAFVIGSCSRRSLQMKPPQNAGVL